MLCSFYANGGRLAQSAAGTSACIELFARRSMVVPRSSRGACFCTRAQGCSADGEHDADPWLQLCNATSGCTRVDELSDSPVAHATTCAQIDQPQVTKIQFEEGARVTARKGMETQHAHCTVDVGYESAAVEA